MNEIPAGLPVGHASFTARGFGFLAGRPEGRGRAPSSRARRHSKKPPGAGFASADAWSAAANRRGTADLVPSRRLSPTFDPRLL